MDIEKARKVPISSLINLDLKKQGQYLLGACPICQEGTDRFAIKTTRDGTELWFCRMCSTSGKYADVITFVRQLYSKSFPEAVEYLAGSPVQAQIKVRKATKPTPKPKKRPKWYKASTDRYNNHYRANLAHVHKAWHQYKAELLPKQIDKALLGYGKLPMSKCKHNRLVLPVFKDNRLVNLRGRQTECDCGKWLVSGGWSLDDLPLYNADSLHPGAIVVVVESPVSAIQIRQDISLVFELFAPQVSDLYGLMSNVQKGLSAIVSVATYSTSYWRPDWQAQLNQASQIIVAFDNDLPGNGGARNRQAMIEALDGKPTPQSRGINLVNKLREDGLNATLLDWGKRPAKYDIGDYLEEVWRE